MLASTKFPKFINLHCWKPQLFEYEILFQMEMGNELWLFQINAYKLTSIFEYRPVATDFDPLLYELILQYYIHTRD